MGKYFLTERAADQLREIYVYSVAEWGDRVAETYMANVIENFQAMARNPEAGKARQQRSTPYLMAPAQKHFAIYKEIPEGVIIACVLHSKRNIEEIMKRIGPALAAEILEIEKDKKG